MSTACIETPYSRVKLHSQRLLVIAPQQPGQPDELLVQIPLDGLERVVIRDQVLITTPAVCELLRRGIPLHYLDGLGHPLGDCLPAQPPAAAARLRQYQRSLDPAFALAVARRLIEAKIYNQHRVLQRLESNHALGLEHELAQLSSAQAQAKHASSIETLRGVEGASTLLYFNLWARFLPAEFPFERRSARPPLNPVNACISFGATLIYQELRAALHLCGLDPALGFLHVPQDGRASLALDLMEPFRPAVAEALTLRLLALGQLRASDFEPSHGGIYLAGAGRKTFLTQYEQRLTREFLGEQAAHRTTLRQQLRQSATALKSALSDPELFQPFRLN